MREGWIGVDLDGTLAVWTEWVAWSVIGEPIEPMVARVRDWLAEGREVRIVTARVGLPRLHGEDSSVCVCKRTEQVYGRADMIEVIQDWCERHVGARLPVQSHKDHDMLELWDDRAVQVVTNTGLSLAEEHAAERAAFRGAP